MVYAVVNLTLFSLCTWYHFIFSPLQEKHFFKVAVICVHNLQLRGFFLMPILLPIPINISGYIFKQLLLKAVNQLREKSLFTLRKCLWKWSDSQALLIHVGSTRSISKLIDDTNISILIQYSCWSIHNLEKLNRTLFNIRRNWVPGK